MHASICCMHGSADCPRPLNLSYSGPDAHMPGSLHLLHLRISALVLLALLSLRDRGVRPQPGAPQGHHRHDDGCVAPVLGRRELAQGQVRPLRSSGQPFKTLPCSCHLHSTPQRSASPQHHHRQARGLGMAGLEREESTGARPVMISSQQQQDRWPDMSVRHSISAAHSLTRRRLSVPSWHGLRSMAACAFSPGSWPQELSPLSFLKEHTDMMRPAHPSQRLPQPQLEACEDAQVHGRRLRGLHTMQKAVTNGACSTLCSGHLLCSPTAHYWACMCLLQHSCTEQVCSKAAVLDGSSMRLLCIQGDTRCCKGEVSAPESQRLPPAACTL